MTLPSSYDLHELCYTDEGSTFNTAFTAADTFQGGATKLQVFDVDLSGLKEEVVEDASVQTAFEGKPGPLRTRKFGSFSFKMYLEGGSDTTTANETTSLIAQAMGGLKSPTAITDAVEATSTATNIVATAHGMDENDIVLIGEPGDGGGDGRTAPIEDATTSADNYDLQLALPAAPTAADVIKNGHQVWIDWADESYQDFLFIGSHVGSGATDDSDQIQMIGCSATLEFGGFGEGEAPFVQFNYNVGNWQWVAYADQAPFQHTTAGSGGVPVMSLDGDAAQIQDTATTTRTEIAGAELVVNLNMQLQPIRVPGNPNGIGGWVKVPTDPGAGPTMNIRAYWANLADMPGIYDDFTARTAKQVLFQFGRTAQAAVTFYMQNAYLRPVDPSTRTNLEESTALDLSFVGSSGAATDLATSAKKQEDAAIILSFN